MGPQRALSSEQFGVVVQNCRLFDTFPPGEHEEEYGAFLIGGDTLRLGLHASEVQVRLIAEAKVKTDKIPPGGCPIWIVSATYPMPTCLRVFCTMCRRQIVAAVSTFLTPNH